MPWSKYLDPELSWGWILGMKSGDEVWGWTFVGRIWYFHPRSRTKVPLALLAWKLECFTIFSDKAKHSQQFYLYFRNPNPKFWKKIGPKLRLLQFCPAWLESRQIWLLRCVRLLEFVFSLEQLQFWSKFSEILKLRYWNTNKTAASVWICLGMFEKMVKH